MRVVALLLALSAPALAVERDFPARGQLVPSGNLRITYATQSGNSLTEVQIVPMLLYLATDTSSAAATLPTAGSRRASAETATA